MEDYPECKLCEMGSLLPFFSPKGEVVYFCTNCRARFSGYVEEPEMEGERVFSDFAEYTSPEGIREKGLPGGKLIEAYRSLLDEHKPIPLERTQPVCQYCGEEITEGESICQSCWLPVEV